MKQDLHPQYYPAAKVKCSCGNAWTTGSVKPELNVSICSNCHPFYTGQEKLLDTKGRVEKFKKRLEKTRQNFGKQNASAKPAAKKAAPKKKAK